MLQAAKLVPLAEKRVQRKRPVRLFAVPRSPATVPQGRAHRFYQADTSPRTAGDAAVTEERYFVRGYN